MSKRIWCYVGRHEYDLYLASWCTDMHEYIQINKEFLGWTRVPYTKFGLAYYLQCKHCNKMVG